MTWENPRSPEERMKDRTEIARKRLNGILAAMNINDPSGQPQKFAIFTGRSDLSTKSNLKLWKIMNKAELENHFSDDTKLLAAAGVHSSLDLTLIPVNGVIEAYL